MRLITWNVNGIRAASRGGFQKWFSAQDADIVCVQEVKAFENQLDPELRGPKGYHVAWHAAEKPGYSGVALFSKREPIRITRGIGISEFDREGRVLIAEYPDFVLINTYFPNSQRDHARLGYKLRFCGEILKLCEDLVSRGKSVVICGDFNIAHKEIDLKNPKTNTDNAGFLPEERAWLDQFVGRKYVDTFRHFEKGPGHYTWWSYRPGVREKNIGWRLDYFFVSPDLTDRLEQVSHQATVKGSDHCPVELKLKD